MIRSDDAKKRYVQKTKKIENEEKSANAKDKNEHYTRNVKIVRK